MPQVDRHDLASRRTRGRLKVKQRSDVIDVAILRIPQIADDLRSNGACVNIPNCYEIPAASRAFDRTEDEITPIPAFAGIRQPVGMIGAGVDDGVGRLRSADAIEERGKTTPDRDVRLPLPFRPVTSVVEAAAVAGPRNWCPVRRTHDRVGEIGAVTGPQGVPAKPPAAGGVRSVRKGTPVWR